MTPPAAPSPLPLQFHASLMRNGSVVAFSTTREGGVSRDAYASLDLGYSGGDDLRNVQENRRLLCETLQLAPDRLLLSRQTHGSEVALIDAAFLRLDGSERETRLEGIDALLTDRAGVCIGVTTADCVPVLLYDPVRRVAGAVHAGWRGTVQRIASRAVRRMTAVFGSRPSDLRALLGPSICPRCFEVGSEVPEAFSAAGYEAATVVVTEAFGKPHVDLRAANRADLVDAGLSADRIETVGCCTYEEHRRYFSARRAGIRSGRFVTGILLTGV